MSGSNNSGNNYKVFLDSVEYRASSTLLTGNQHGSYGIAFENLMGSGNEISQNWIRSHLGHVDTFPEVSDKSFIKCGIHVFSCQAPTICANDVDSTYRGFHLSEKNLGTVFGLNNIQTHVFGIHCSMGSNSGMITNIEDQIRRGNVWSTNPNHYVSGGVGAKYADGSPPFVFKYNAANAGHVPPNGTPDLSIWFLTQAGAVDGCLERSGKFEDGEIDIAKDIYPYTTAAAHWDLQRSLWNKLVRNPGLEEEDDDVEDFYIDSENSSPNLFAAALYQFEQAFIPSSTLRNDLNDALYLANAQEVDIISLLETIGADTTTIDSGDAADLATAWFTMTTIQASINDLVDDYIDERDDKLNTLATDINYLPLDDPWEKDWWTVLDAAITQGKGEVLNSTQKDNLIEIANSCASEVGLVAQAVVAYMPAEDGHPFMGRESSDDCVALDRSDNKEQSLSQFSVNQAFMLSPNPVSNRLTALLPTASGGNWKVLSSTGGIITKGSFIPGQLRLNLDVSLYPTGLYLLQIQPNSGKRVTKKFSVIK